MTSLPKKLNDRIDLVNQHIAIAMNHDLAVASAGVESDYPTGMQFDKLITVCKERHMATISYWEGYGDRHSIDEFDLKNTDPDDFYGRYEFLEFLKYILRIIKYTVKEEKRIGKLR